jgi:hypothetical protein
MTRKNLSGVLWFLFLSLGFFLVNARFNQVDAASLDSVSASLNNSRFSFRSALEGVQTLGSSLITIDTSNYPSSSVLQLQSGDVLRIGGTNNYNVATTIDDATDDKVSLTSGLLTGDIADETAIISTQSSTLTVKLTTVSALEDGTFRILVPATSDTESSRDGLPDDDAFDFGGSSNAAITCPTTYPGAYTSFTPTSSYADGTVSMDGIDYHVFDCAYTGVGAVGSDFDDTTNDAFVIENLINPSPSSSSVLGEADAYTIIVQQLSSDDTVVDETVVKVGVIDAVRVSATILPQLTFTITGVASLQSKCGITTDATTTPLAVPFGDLTIGTFSDLAQVLTVTTNAVNGYQVTAAENDQLGKDGQACSGDGSSDTACIVDANVSGMSDSASEDWAVVTGDKYGFGFTMGTATGGITRAFYYNEDPGGGARTYSARHFADLAAGSSPQVIFSRSSAALEDVVDVCYRLTPSAENVAGDYENYIVYTATATF